MQNQNFNQPSPHYTPLEDEIMPWDREPESQSRFKPKPITPAQNTNTHSPYHNHTHPSGFDSREHYPKRRRSVRMPYRCKWVETSPYRVLMLNYHSYFLFIFGVCWLGFCSIPLFFISITPEMLSMIHETVSKDPAILLFLLFPLAGIIMTVGGFSMAFSKTWITCKEREFEIRKGIKREGSTKIIPKQDAIIESYSNLQVNGRPLYNVKLIDPYSENSVIIASGLEYYQANEFCEFMDSLIREESESV